MSTLDDLRGGWDHPFRKSLRGLQNVIMRVVFFVGMEKGLRKLNELFFWGEIIKGGHYAVKAQ